MSWGERSDGVNVVGRAKRRGECRGASEATVVNVVGRAKRRGVDTDGVSTPGICEQFGIDFPLFAFSHCRDVVAAVTNAGGFGVLGATAYTPEQLDQELTWIDEHVHGKPYGADIIVPAKFEGKGENLSRTQLVDRIPDEYRGFVARLLNEHGIEAESTPRIGGSALTGDTGRELLDGGDEPPDQADRQRPRRAARLHDRGGPRAWHTRRCPGRRQGARGQAGGRRRRSDRRAGHGGGRGTAAR